MAVSNAGCPKFTVMIGGSVRRGRATMDMAGRAYSPRLLWMWPKQPDQRDGRRRNVLLTVRRDAGARQICHPMSMAVYAADPGYIRGRRQAVFHGALVGTASSSPLTRAWRWRWA